jgi:hypothetical protein
VHVAGGVKVVVIGPSTTTRRLVELMAVTYARETICIKNGFQISPGESREDIHIK